MTDSGDEITSCHEFNYCQFRSGDFGIFVTPMFPPSSYCYDATVDICLFLAVAHHIHGGRTFILHVCEWMDGCMDG